MIVAEVGQAHDGSMLMAHSFIELAADAGADAIKFQTHFADHESTLNEEFRVHSRFVYDDNRYGYWKRVEFDYFQWSELAAHAREKGLKFISSPFSVFAVELLDRLGVDHFKLGSGEVFAGAVLDACLETDRPIILSTGMSGWSEVDAQVEKVRQSIDLDDLVLMHCVSKYPVPLENLGLNNLELMAARYPDIAIGLSDHSGKLSPSLIALARGAKCIEVHVTVHKSMIGFDVESSLDFEQLAFLCNFKKELSIMENNPTDKNKDASSLVEIKKMFGKSIALRHDLPVGHILEPHDFTEKKPGGGISIKRASELVGKRLTRNVEFNRLLREDDFE